MAPTSSLSLSIGTTICERAPANCADSGLLSSQVAAERFVQQSVDKRGRCTDHGLRDERVIAMAEQHAKLGLTDAKCILHHRTEHRLQLARRAADDLKDLGGRRLLRQRFA